MQKGICLLRLFLYGIPRSQANHQMGAFPIETGFLNIASSWTQQPQTVDGGNEWLL